MMREGGDLRRFHVVGFFYRFRWQCRFRERAIRNIAFHARLGLHFYITLNATNDLDRLAAFQLGGQIEIHHRFVDPHAVLIHGALNIDTRRFCTGDATEARDYENCSKRPNHFPSASVRGLEISGLKMPDTVIRMRPAMRHQPREIGDRETELRGSGARMTSRIVKPGARREPHGDPQGYRSQIVRNGLFSMTRSESGAQLTER